MNEQDIMIEVNHMSHIYTDENGNDVRALDDVNLSIKRGEFVCIIGTNGSGKSTLAKHFNVLLQPSEGHINVCGFDTRDEAHIWNIRQHVGMVFQNPDNQIVAAVVEEDVAFGPENLGIPMENMFRAIKRVLDENPDVKAIYPIHKNPRVRNIANDIFGDNPTNIKIIEPLEVLDFHNFMNKSYLILTDSGGIQEEAPSLGKPVLVMRDTTERPEGISAGTLKLVGTDESSIYKHFTLLLTNSTEYVKMSQASNPYGDGTASQKIAKIISETN